MVDVNTGLPVQVGSEKYALNVIVPVGLPNPPDRVAVSIAKLGVVARVTFEGDTEVVMDGLAGRTMNSSGSGSQGAVNGLLLASPL